MVSTRKKVKFKKSVPLHWLSLIYMYTSPLLRCLVRRKRLSS